MKISLLNLGLIAALLYSLTVQAQPEKAVAEHYTIIAHAVFDDALKSAKTLGKTIDRLIKKPSKKQLEAAKVAWKAARIPYQQAEVFRFGNPNVDDWEGQLNAWPLDEGLIDYVSRDYEQVLGNAGATANIIANTSLKIGGETLDLSKITPELLASLNELSGSEANVATGYHAIEFLLWGQDLNGTDSGAGERPHTDFTFGTKCTNGNCERRGEFLKAAIRLLISDLEDMVAQWAPGKKDNYRAEFIALPSTESLRHILYGMGSLSLGELAGERMKVALEANSPEDEHDCFSDNTHYSHFYNAKGVRNIYLGEYHRINGSILQGPGISSLLAAKDAKLDQTLKSALENTEQKLQTLVDSAESKKPMKFDQMIAPNNQQGAQIIRESIQALVAQTLGIEQAALRIGISNLNPDTADHSF